VNFIPGLVLNDDGTALAAGVAGGESVLDRSVDSGLTWTQVPIPTQGQLHTFDWVEGTSDVWGVTSQSGLFHSTNGGLNWGLPEFPAPPNSLIIEDIDFVDQNIGWCVGWSPQNTSGRIFRYSNTAGVANSELVPDPLHAWVHPNPFEEDVWFHWEAMRPARVNISIYDVAGRKLWTGAGTDGSYLWSGKGEAGQALSGGVYFYRLQSGAIEVTGRLIKAQ
jgi:hypothetical protein